MSKITDYDEVTSLNLSVTLFDVSTDLSGFKTRGITGTNLKTALGIDGFLSETPTTEKSILLNGNNWGYKQGANDLFKMLANTLQAYFGGDLAVGGSTFVSDASLSLNSTTKGLRLNNLTTANREAILTPSKGLLLYDSDTDTPYFGNGTTWSVLGNDNLATKDIVLNRAVATIKTNTVDNTSGLKITNNNDDYILTLLGDRSANFGGDVSILGNLIISGTTTTVNSTVTTIKDPILTLGGDSPPVSDDNKDRGMEFRWYDGAAKIGFFGFDDSTGRLTFIPDGTNTSEVFTGALGDVDFAKGFFTGFQLSTAPTVGYALVSDASGNGTWQAVTGGLYGGDGSLVEDTDVTMNAFGLNFKGNQTTFKGINDAAGTFSFRAENDSNTHSIKYSNTGVFTNTGDIVTGRIGTAGAIFGSGRVMDIKGTGANIGILRAHTGNGSISFGLAGANDPRIVLIDNTGTTKGNLRSAGVSYFIDAFAIGQSSVDSGVIFQTIAGDVKHEGLTDEYTLFVDHSSDRVGMGVAVPTEKLDLLGNINISGVFKVGGTAGLSETISFGGGGTGDIATMTFIGGIYTSKTLVP